MNIKTKVIELGGTGVVPGPSKMYATGFLFPTSAREFISWMNDNYETAHVGNIIKMRNGTYDVGYDAN